MIASPNTLDALELPALLDLVASESRTDLGAARLQATRPAHSVAELMARRSAYEEVAGLVVEAPLVPSFDALFGPLLERLVSGQPSLDGAEILVLARLLAAGGEAARRVTEADPPCAELSRRLEELGDPRPLVARIERVLDSRGRVRDDASPRLAALGRDVRACRDRLYAQLESLRGAHADLFAEETVPLRGGRLLLMLSAGARGRMPGLVHGRSASGKSFYFEPLDVVEENNTLETAVEEQEAERRRLLNELLAALAAELPLVERLARFVAELDALEALGRYARAAAARLPELAAPGRLRLVAARHPLLDPRLARLRERVLGAPGHAGEIVPLDLELDSERRILVVTGPNAGGKTVALKTLGLAVLAAQSGLPVPCAAGSELPFFTHVVATMGDDQDLLSERSTFSGRLARLAEAWSTASPASLALLDELGSGTDPEEGSALALALVEHLIASGGSALVTTHLTPVALAALERPGAACAAMEFDPANGRPTFHLRPGSPGASEAIALARRMGLPPEWVRRAESLLGEGHRDLRRVLEEARDAAWRARPRHGGRRGAGASERGGDGARGASASGARGGATFAGRSGQAGARGVPLARPKPPRRRARAGPQRGSRRAAARTWLVAPQNVSSQTLRRSRARPQTTRRRDRSWWAAGCATASLAGVAGFWSSRRIMPRWESPASGSAVGPTSWWD